jgi:hypothetical protein
MPLARPNENGKEGGGREKILFAPLQHAGVDGWMDVCMCVYVCFSHGTRSSSSDSSSSLATSSRSCLSFYKWKKKEGLLGQFVKEEKTG